MFKHSFILLFILLSTLLADDSKINIGISFGPNYTELNYEELFDPWEKTEYQCNYNFNFNAEYYFYKNFALQSGLRYTTISNKIVMDKEQNDPFWPDSTIIDYSNIFHKYLSLPILLKYNPPFVNSFYVISGLEFGYLLTSFYNQTMLDGKEYKNEKLDELNKFNLAYDIGLGYEKEFGHFILNISLVYSYGLLVIPHKENYIVSWKTREIYSKVGINYRL